MSTHYHDLKHGIVRNRESQRRGLAPYAANTGLVGRRRPWALYGRGISGRHTQLSSSRTSEPASGDFTISASYDSCCMARVWAQRIWPVSKKIPPASYGSAFQCMNERGRTMQLSMGSLSSISTTVILCAVFILVFVVSHRALKEMSFFGRNGNWLVACCVALLSVVGLVRFFGSSQQSTAGFGGHPEETDGLVDFILLPYVVLPIAIVLTLLLSHLLNFLGHGDWTRTGHRASEKRLPFTGSKERSGEFQRTDDMRTRERSSELIAPRTRHLDDTVKRRLER